MTVVAFPPIEFADDQGLLAVGGDLEVDSLLLAYRSGIFPWPYDSSRLLWFAPPNRGVLFMDEVHIPKRLARSIRNDGFEFAVNRNFDRVIESCAEVINRGDQSGTWITDEMKQAFKDFHKAGYCHSYETYLDGTLVGGAYGVRIGNFCTGESMFYRVPNASKFAVAKMIETLRHDGVSWIDCQMLTPVTKMFGARMVDREEFMELLRESLGE